MKIQFSLNVRPFSINKMYYRGNFQRTQEARNWASEVFQELNKSEVQSLLASFKEKFNKNKQGIKVTLYFRYPEEKLLTKKGAISSRAFDLTNVEKPLIDLIFGPKYNKRRFPDGCKNLNLDDKYIIDCCSYKRPSVLNEHSIGIILEIVDLNWEKSNGE